MPINLISCATYLRNVHDKIVILHFCARENLVILRWKLSNKWNLCSLPVNIFKINSLLENYSSLSHALFHGWKFPNSRNHLSKQVRVKVKRKWEDYTTKQIEKFKVSRPLPFVLLLWLRKYLFPLELAFLPLQNSCMDRCRCKE